MFAAALVGAILRGRAGAPCACFGSRSTVGWTSVLRNLALAAGFAALPLLPRAEPVDRAVARARARGRPARCAWASASRCWRWPARSGCCACGSAPPRRSRSPRRAPSSASGWRLIERFARPRRARRSRSPSSPPRAAASAAGSSPRSPRSPTTRRSRSRSFDEVADADVWRELRDPGQPVRDRARSGRHRARQGDLQQPRPARERARHRRAAPAGPRRGAASRWASETGSARRSTSLARRHLPPRLPGASRRRAARRRPPAAIVAKAVKPGEARRLPLLRPHLHDRLLHPPARPAAGRLARLPAPSQRRQADRQHRPARERPRACRSTTTATC